MQPKKLLNKNEFQMGPKRGERPFKAFSLVIQQKDSSRMLQLAEQALHAKKLLSHMRFPCEAHVVAGNIACAQLKVVCKHYNMSPVNSIQPIGE